MIMRMSLVLLVFSVQLSFAEEIKVNSVKTYSAWKNINDLFLKDCASESSAQKRILKSLHVPTITLNREGVCRVSPTGTQYRPTNSDPPFQAVF